MEKKFSVDTYSFILGCYTFIIGISTSLMVGGSLISLRMYGSLYRGSNAAVIVVLFVSYRLFDKIPLVNTFLACFGKNSLIVLCFHLIEMTAIPFQSVVDFGLSIVGIDVFGLSVILTVFIKVLWCCLAIWIVNKSVLLRWVFNIKNNQLFKERK